MVQRQKPETVVNVCDAKTAQTVLVLDLLLILNNNPRFEESVINVNMRGQIPDTMVKKDCATKKHWLYKWKDSNPFSRNTCDFVPFTKLSTKSNVCKDCTSYLSIELCPSLHAISAFTFDPIKHVARKFQLDDWILFRSRRSRAEERGRSER
jgi:hypothetical protein